MNGYPLMRDELWKEVPGFSKYEISTCGRVRNKRTARLVRQSVSSSGYVQVWLYNDFGKPRSEKVHRLVGEAFLGAKDFQDIHHINEDLSDNSAENLRPMSRQEHNILHFSGEKSVHAKLTLLHARLVRTLFRRGISRYRLAKMCGTSQTVIDNILTGKTYKEDSDETG